MPYDSTCMWNLKYDTKEPIYRTEIVSQTWRIDLWLPRGEGTGEDWIGNVGLTVSPVITISPIVDANCYI